MHKKRIAIITHGGISTGPNSEGVPVVSNMVDGLALDFDITVYSLESPHKNFNPVNYTIKSTPFKASSKLSIRLPGSSC